MFDYVPTLINAHDFCSHDTVAINIDRNKDCPKHLKHLQVDPLSTISVILPKVIHGHQHVRQPANTQNHR